MINFTLDIKPSEIMRMILKMISMTLVNHAHEIKKQNKAFKSTLVFTYL